MINEWASEYLDYNEKINLKIYTCSDCNLATVIPEDVNYEYCPHCGYSPMPEKLDISQMIDTLDDCVHGRCGRCRYENDKATECTKKIRAIMHQMLRKKL